MALYLPYVFNSPHPHEKSIKTTNTTGRDILVATTYDAEGKPKLEILDPPHPQTESHD